MRLCRFPSALLAGTIFVATAQTQRPAIVSPEILPDRRVIFRLWAPTATEVQLSGDWMGPQPPAGLTKDERGVWSVAAGPFEPNIYTYAFLVNGVRAPDPVCRCALTWAGRMASSRFTIAGSPSEPWEEGRAPKGTLHSESYYSEEGQRIRRFVVYTPPGYSPSSSRTLPVLVLLPGTPGDENDWTTGGGFADAVFDNLIATRRMQPMIVAMHASDVLANGRRADNLKAFEPLLVNEFIPHLKRRYRPTNKPEAWAIAGLSLGGEVAMTVGLRHPELFRSVASLSGSMVERDFDDRFGAALAKAADIRSRYRLIWMGCGREDIFFAGNQALAARFKSAGIAYRFVELPGLHVMPVFRRELVDLLSRLFR